ncbi:MAG: amidohydrolase family protein [Rhizobiaceae bacterium]|nr:amidohydrolase family protein [Rhizobiaceae bacterium]
MIFDSHLHLFRHGYRFGRESPLQGQTDVDAYEALMARHGIGGGIVVCYEAHGIDPGNNAYVRGLAAERPWITSVAYLDANAPPDPEAIERLLSDGHAGIALYLADADAANALARWPAGSWQLLSRSRAIVSLNARPQAIAALEPIVVGASGCQFLFAHLGLPGAQEQRPSIAIARQGLAPLLSLASVGNVGVKISGLYAVDPRPPHAGAAAFVEALVEVFRPTDLHWGSDFSPALEFVSFEDSLELAWLSVLPQPHLRLIMGEGLALKLRRAGQL